MKMYIVCYSNTNWQGDYHPICAVVDFELAYEITCKAAESIGKNMKYAHLYDAYTDGYNYVWFDEVDTADSIENASEWIQLAHDLSTGLYVGAAEWR